MWVEEESVIVTGAVVVDGCRKLKGSCLVLSPGGGRMRLRKGGVTLLYREKFKLNTSNILCKPMRVSKGLNIHVFGTSKDRSTVDKGNIHVFTGCLVSGKCVARGGFSVRAVSNAVRIRYLGDQTARFGMGVKGPSFVSDSVPISNRIHRMVGRGFMFRKGRCGTAYLAINGPRYVVFASGMDTRTMGGLKPCIRGTSRFPREVGLRVYHRISGKGLRVRV